jgi:hypothetical protein
LHLLEISDYSLSMNPDVMREITEEFPRCFDADQLGVILKTIRANYNRRHQLRLQHLAEAERQLKCAFAGTNVVELFEQGEANQVRPKRPLLGIKIVRHVLADFGQTPFSLDDVANRVSREFPGQTIDRAMLSRRLFDLRRFGEVTLATMGEETSEPLSRNQRKRLYRLMPPKSQ